MKLEIFRNLLTIKNSEAKNGQNPKNTENRVFWGPLLEVRNRSHVANHPSNISRGRTGYLWSLRAGALCKHQNLVASKMDFGENPPIGKRPKLPKKAKMLDFHDFSWFLGAGFRSVRRGLTWNLTRDWSEGSLRYLWSYSRGYACKMRFLAASEMDFKTFRVCFSKGEIDRGRPTPQVTL